MGYPSYDLTLNGYQDQAARTLDGLRGRDDKLACCALGIAGEAGEVADLLKKILFHGHKMDRKALTKELGDVLWYLSGIATTLNVSLEDVARENLDKLEKRYPSGFNPADSQARRDTEIP